MASSFCQRQQRLQLQSASGSSIHLLQSLSSLQNRLQVSSQRFRLQSSHLSPDTHTCDTSLLCPLPPALSPLPDCHPRSNGHMGENNNNIAADGMINSEMKGTASPTGTTIVPVADHLISCSQQQQQQSLPISSCVLSAASGATTSLPQQQNPLSSPTHSLAVTPATSSSSFNLSYPTSSCSNVNVLLTHQSPPQQQQHQQQQQQSQSTTSANPHLPNHQSNASPQPVMFTSADYLAQLLKDQKQVSAFPGVFFHLERLLNDEINRVRSTLFQITGSEKKPLMLPEPDGPVMCKSDKILVPIDKHPEYNFVGRILGPRGMTAKQLELETGCKIMVRGKGSMRDRKKEEQNRGKPNWEHLNEPLHVLITCEDTATRAEVKLMRAREEVEKLLVPVADGEDDLKKRQLMELAIINGTYRDSGCKQQQQGMESEQLKPLQMPILRHPGLGAPLIIGPQHLLAQHLMNGGHPSLLSQHPDPGALFYSRSPYDFGAQYAHNLLAASAPHLLDFQAQTNAADGLASAPGKQRRSVLLTNVREHPYQVRPHVVNKKNG